MPELTTFHYGSHPHPQGEVNLVKVEKIPQLTRRNEKWGEWRKLHIMVDLNYDQDTLNSKIAELESVYSLNDLSCGLKLPDGTQTEHWLNQADANNMSGNKVLHFSYPRGSSEELVNTRTAYIIVGALFRDPDSAILWYEENVRIIGDGQEEWEWVKLQTGPLQRQVIYEETSQIVLQRGFIYAMDNWAIGNLPPPVLSADWVKNTRKHTEYLYPRWLGNAYYNYGLGWHYEMHTPPGEAAFPTIYTE